MARTVSWFSCGAASAVATKLAKPDVIAYCHVREEHPDNMRFLKDCEKWFDQEVVVLGNDKYDRSIYDVFEKTRFLKGPTGARCTTELKKNVRRDFGRVDDRLVFGFTVEERHRSDRLKRDNPDSEVWPILIERGLTKANCLAMVERAGIELPVMYQLGYRNNNCIGCVKGEAGYWNKIRVDFPDVFERMAQTEERLGRTVCKTEWTKNGKRHLKRVSLCDLPPDAGNYPKEPDIECGLLCAAAENEMSDFEKTGENNGT